MWSNDVIARQYLQTVDCFLFLLSVIVGVVAVAEAWPRRQRGNDVIARACALF